jgi:nitroimidazol reductase NimA-like FMN-containing flavoprotein (pyridoxamine 5'-phosphate oxidase superfamily)
MRELIELTRTECLALLAATDFGRVVVTAPAAHTPVIRPVNYLFDPPSESVIFRTAEGSKFHALVRSARATFEIDAIDANNRCGWSVIIAGVTEEVTRPMEVLRLDRLGLDTWAPGARPHWVRIRARTVSGRRIVLTTDDAPASDRAS